MAAKLKDVERVLANGGLIRFYWHKCRVELISATGTVEILDGRSYQAFLAKHTDGVFSYGVQRTETGSTDNKDLIIEWRRA